jgi:phosphoribosylaminoimidazole-succinocarboxamide synthase
MVSEEHITAFAWATSQELDEIMALSLRINDFLSGLFVGVGIRLVDFKLEYGRHYNANDELTILLADEISPDSCRLWDVSGSEKMDKGHIHRDMSGVAEAYQEVAQRLGIMPESGPRDIQGPKVMQ